MSAPLHLQITQIPDENTTIDTLLNRGVDTIMPEDGFKTLLSNRRVKLYLGIDPTSPYLHIGHTVPLRKLRQFQQLGHEVILLFGSFTGMVGDPSDKTSTRVQLTREQVMANVTTYVEQAGMILDLSPSADNPVTIVYNDEWLSPLDFQDILEIASHFTVNQLLGRRSYQERLDSGNPLYLHEMMYPLMQAYDAVHLDVDLEVGGKDQIPNMLAGAHLVVRMKGHRKWVLGMRLIEDPSGAKMGKTSGNVVNIVEFPEVIYEALMTWPDTAVAVGLEVLTSLPMPIVHAVEHEFNLIQQGRSTEHPVRLKEAFAFRVVADLHGQEAAEKARDIFDQVKRRKQLPPRMIECSFDRGISLAEVLVQSGLALDADEAQSRITQSAVRIDSKLHRKNNVLPQGEYVVEIGKRSIKNVRKVKIR